MALDAVKQDRNLSERLDRCVMRAYGAEEHVQRLLGTAVEEVKLTDIVKLVEDIMADLKPMADSHPCELLPIGRWEKGIMVRGIEFQLRRALSNLIENAIKYSYSYRGNRITMFIDIQAKLLFYVVVAWEDDFTGYVIDYGSYRTRQLDADRLYRTGHPRMSTGPLRRRHGRDDSTTRLSTAIGPEIRRSVRARNAGGMRP